MAKTKQQKQEIIQKLKDNFIHAKSIIFVSFDKLKVNDVNRLRTKCAQEGLEYIVAKKTLINIAAKEAQLDINAGAFEGQVAIAFSKDDEVAPAKILHNFGKGLESFSLLGGVLEGKMIDSSDVISLALLPSYNELLAKMIGSMRAPVSGLVNTLSGVARGFIQVLNQIAQNKDKA